MSIAMCRTCLTDGVLTHSIRNTELQEVYEKLSNTKLIIEDGRPETVCYTCCLQLQKCYDFSIMSQKADTMLTQLYRNGIKISSDKVAALHKTLESFGSNNPTFPNDFSRYNIPMVNYPTQGTTSQPLVDYPMHDEVTVKLEPDPLIEDNYISDDTKMEDMYNNENENTAVDMPYPVSPLISPLMNCETQMTEDKYTCETCNKTFSFKKNLKAHIKLHIRERLCEPKAESTQPHVCKECGESFPLLSSLRQHMTSHTEEKPFKCKICKQSISDAGVLIMHMKKHLGEKPYRCDECGKSLSDKQNFTRHMRLHSGEMPYACNLCEYRTSYSSCLKAHVASHTGEMLYGCIECNVSFTRPDNLRRHNMRSHTGDYACELCSKKFSDSNKLKNHMMSHTRNKSFNCSECVASFTQLHNLRRHMRSHSGEKPYVCGKCDYKSAHPHRLKLHLARKHQEIQITLEPIVKIENSAEKHPLADEASVVKIENCSPDRHPLPDEAPLVEEVLP